MNTEEKCAFIIRKVIELANERGQFIFERDFGGNTSTILIPHENGKNVSHTHVGVPSGTFATLIDNLYNSLHGRKGLSWVESLKEEDQNDS